MAKTPNQRLRLIYVKEMLERQTDEKHPATSSDIIRYLEKKGISAERKAIYEDIEALKLYGMDIILSGKGGYYLGSRDFELAELKLLADSVQASKFLTQKKSDSLIGKIERLTGEKRAAQLHRQVYVVKRIKNMNESIYYNVDRLHEAIGSDRKISFLYFDYNVNKVRVYRKDGKRYSVSPYALIWDNENYYLVAYDSSEGKLKHYRVDKMNDIKLERKKREGSEAFGSEDMSSYANKIFGMFTGRERMVTIEFAEHLAHAVIDRFGKEVVLVPKREGCFTVSASVAVSPKFFAWVFGFGTEARIVRPEDVAEQMRDYVKKVLELY
jgi:predicted DNA-binding transcriptional regulator YafY